MHDEVVCVDTHLSRPYWLIREAGHTLCLIDIPVTESAFDVLFPLLEAEDAR